MPPFFLFSMASSAFVFLKAVLRDPAIQRKILAALVRRLARRL